MFQRVLTEAIIVAISSVVAGLLISSLLMYLKNSNFSFKTYKHWPAVALSFFLTGFILHIIFEYTGLNKVYCTKGNACIEDK